MARERPIKLHIKDGKDTTFRLIGPKGRVLNTLDWDGERLELQDAFNEEDVQAELIGNANEETQTEETEELDESQAKMAELMEDAEVNTIEPVAKEGDENLTDILGDEPPASPADAPDSGARQAPEIGAEDEGVDDVSGENEAEINDQELADILAEDTASVPDIEESDDVPEEMDSKTEAVEETKKPY